MIRSLRDTRPTACRHASSGLGPRARLLVGLLCLVPALSPTGYADDGWRRTVHGWERVAAAGQATEFAPPHTLATPVGFDDWRLHPLLFCVGQLAFVAAALAGLHTGTLGRFPRRQGGGFAAIRTSFRASAFGD